MTHKKQIFAIYKLSQIFHLLISHHAPCLKSVLLRGPKEEAHVNRSRATLQRMYEVSTAESPNIVALVNTVADLHIKDSVIQDVSGYYCREF